MFRGGGGEDMYREGKGRYEKRKELIKEETEQERGERGQALQKLGRTNFLFFFFFLHTNLF